MSVSRPGGVPLISVRMLEEPVELMTAERLLQRVWGSDAVQLNAATMRAFAHTGNYVAGAFLSDESSEPGEMVACAVGFFAPPDERSLHSHIAGVDSRFAGRGIGTALKNHQRAWCLDRGVTSMTWTFDPAIARNAFFNITKLGVSVMAYLENFYGALDDDLNAGSPTDRLLVRWDLQITARVRTAAATATAAGASALDVDRDGEPVVRGVDPVVSPVLVQIPADMEGLRRTDPTRAARWRFALREVLGPYVNDEAWRVTGFLKQGYYVLERTA